MLCYLESQAYSHLKFRVGDEMEVRVLSAVNPDNVVIRPTSLLADFEQMSNQLQTKYSGM